MKKGRRWKAAAGYVFGMLILAASITAALLFPQWYSEWQDEQIMDKVTLQNRESIQFLDTDQLDIAGRMQVVSQAETLHWYETWNETYSSEEGERTFTEHCQSALQLWSDCGLLPPGCVDYLKEAEAGTGTTHFVNVVQLFVEADQTYIPMCFLVLESSEMRLSFLIDTEVELIYYASFASEGIPEILAQKAGFDSANQWEERLGTEKNWNFEEDYSGYDFASACKAERAQIVDNRFFPELEIALTYDNFTSYAYRGTADCSGRMGQTFLFGTQQWKRIAQEILSVYGYHEESHDWEGIYAQLLADGIWNSAEVLETETEAIKEEALMDERAVSGQKKEIE